MEMVMEMASVSSGSSDEMDLRFFFCGVSPFATVVMRIKYGPLYEICLV
jgi:hypothetical protein